MEVAFVLGNGESRKGIQIEELKKIGKVFACNGVYRSDTPDVLVAVDPKMLLEIAENDYMDNNVVWSNYNAMYEKHSKIMEKVQFFQPSLGWSSGPTALKYAADHNPKTIYILGFDYQGHSDKQNKKFNNLFKDTRNYKKSNEDATFFGNWMNQTKRVLKDYPNIEFVRVTPRGWFRPNDLEWNKNIKHVDIEEFLRIHSLQLRF